MTPYPGSLYLCLLGIATVGVLVSVGFSGELRLDAWLWLAIAIVASVLYFVTPRAAIAS